jgi:alkaline phosphatase
VLIIPDGMHVNNEIQYSMYQYGEQKAASFHSWPYHCYMTTWDVDTYNKYAWQRAQASATSQSAQQYDPTSFDPTNGYDPAIGGTRPREGAPGPEDDYFISQLPKWGETPEDGVKEPATDSASAATAFATGYKTDAGNVSWLPGDPPAGSLLTIAERFRQQTGGAVGSTSTVQLSHATPACFNAHNVNRNNYQEIAEEVLTDTLFDVIIGAGHPVFTLNGDGTPKTKYCPPDFLDTVKANGDYTVVEKQNGADGGELLRAAAAEAAANGGKLCGVFGCAAGHLERIMPLDTPGAPSWDMPTGDPHADDIAVAALDVLSQNPNGFFLMVEQGDLDWCNHANDYAGGVGCMRDTDLCAQAVVDWINQPGDGITLDNTSVIVVPDHTHYIRQNEWLGIGDLPQQVEIEGEAEPYEGSFRYPDGEPYYHSNNHTNELGNVYIIGGGVAAALAQYEGDWYSDTRIVDNTHLYRAMAEWLGVN